MFSNNMLGCDGDNLKSMIIKSEELNYKVVEQINLNQELCVIKTFEQEANEQQIQNTIGMRISEISSWRWVLDDVARRVDDVIGLLEHEEHAVRVVLERLGDEIAVHSKRASKPAALKPYRDDVEDAILKEYNFLCLQKVDFEKLSKYLEKQILRTKKTKRRITEDLLRKNDSIAIDKACLQQDPDCDRVVKRKKLLLKLTWEKRCESLKTVGLETLINALSTREKVRRARVNLSNCAQAEAATVDNMLRRRLHANEKKLEELSWQKNEAKRDSKMLMAELISNENTIDVIVEQIRVVEARISQRKLRPPGEVVRDEVDRRLHNELVRLKRSVRDLNAAIQNIRSLQNHLHESVTHIDCCAEDLNNVIHLDRSRIKSRLGVQSTKQITENEAKPNINSLTVIFEEDE